MNRDGKHTSGSTGKQEGEKVALARPVPRNPARIPPQHLQTQSVPKPSIHRGGPTLCRIRI